MRERKVPLIEDSFWSESRVLEEQDSKTSEKRMVIIGQVQEADAPNKNNRVYPFEVLNSAVRELKDKIKKGRVFGNVDHPEVAKLMDASHLVKDVWWASTDDGKPSKKLMAELVVLNTPAGGIIKEILKAGGRPGFSSRGYGDVEEVELESDGTKKKVERVKEGYQLESFDFVIDPSVDSATIHQIIECANPVQKEKLEEEVKELETEKEKVDNEPEEKKEEPKEESKEESKEEILEKCYGIISGISKILVENGVLEMPRLMKVNEDVERSLTKQLAEASQEIELLSTKLREAEEKFKKLEEEKKLLEVEHYIFEKTASDRFGSMYRKKLLEKKLTSKEEVDKELKGLKEVAEEAMKNKDIPLGKGQEKRMNEVSKNASSGGVSEEFRNWLRAMANIKHKEEK